MSAIAIVYFSGTGTTKAMAEAVTKGAGPGAVLLPIVPANIVEGRFKDDALFATLNAAKAIVFGTPTYMGGPAAQFKAFADATSGAWMQRAWVGKIAAGFTVSGSMSGDKQGTLQYLVTLAMQQGMIWIGQPEMPGMFAGQPFDQAVNRLGSHTGVMGQALPGSALAPGDLLTGEHLGARIAAAVAKG